jgi:hypothetical protein
MEDLAVDLKRLGRELESGNILVTSEQEVKASSSGIRRSSI